MPTPPAKKTKSIILTLLDNNELDLLASDSNNFGTQESDNEQESDGDDDDENVEGEEDEDKEGDNDKEELEEDQEQEQHAIPSPPLTAHKLKRSHTVGNKTVAMFWTF